MLTLSVPANICFSFSPFLVRSKMDCFQFELMRNFPKSVHCLYLKKKTKCSSDLTFVYRKYLGCSKRAKDRTCVIKTKHSGYGWTLSSGCRMVPVEGLILRGTLHPQLPMVAERVFKRPAGSGCSASDSRYWFYSLSLLSLECFCWEAPVCVARAECPPSRNLAKPLASGKCLFGGNSVGYFFSLHAIMNE